MLGWSPAGPGMVAGSRSCPWEQIWGGDRNKGVLPAPKPCSASQVRCWRHDEKEENAKRIRTVGNQTSTKVSNLRGNALYHLAVRAYNTAGTGPSSAAVNVTTKKPRECWQGCPGRSSHCSPVSFPSSLESQGAVRLLLARFLCRFTRLSLFISFYS